MTGLSVESLELLFNKGEDYVPKLWCLFKFIHGNIVETVHDLPIGHILSVLLVNKDDIVSVFCAHKSKVYFIMNERPMIIKVSVSAGMYLTIRDWCDLSERSRSHREHASASKLENSLQHFYYYIL